MNDTPSSRLAEQVFARLAAAGLVRDARRDGLVDKLANGRMTAADWRTEIDLADEQAPR